MMTWIILFFALLVGWRYRRLLGLEAAYRRTALRLQDQIGVRPRQTAWSGEAATSRRQQRQALTTPRFRFDASRLPSAVTAGMVLMAVSLAIDVLGHSLTATLVGTLIGPIAGGLYLRTRWWTLAAGAAAIVVGATGELPPYALAVPVAMIAYAASRYDARAALERWFGGRVGSR